MTSVLLENNHTNVLFNPILATESQLKSCTNMSLFSWNGKGINYIDRVKTTDGLISGVDFSEFRTQFVALQSNDNLITHLNNHREKVLVK